MTNKERQINISGGQYNEGSNYGIQVGGDYIEGDKSDHNEEFQGDLIHGDKIEGDKIKVGDISDSKAVAVGAAASAALTNDASALMKTFAPLYDIVAQYAPTQSAQVNKLKTFVSVGANEDKQIAGLIQDICDDVPAARSVMQTIFCEPSLADVASAPRVEFVLDRLSR